MRLVTTLVALAVAFLAGGCTDDEAPSRKGDGGRSATPCASFTFDTARWIRLQDPDRDSPRVVRERMRMATRIVRCHALDGMTRADVRSLLGPPSREDRAYMEYYIGPEESTWSIDDMWLFIDITRGRVSNYEVGQG